MWAQLNVKQVRVFNNFEYFISLKYIYSFVLILAMQLNVIDNGF